MPGRRPPRNVIADLAGAIGATAITAGVGLIAGLGAALITLGAFALLLAYDRSQ